MINAPVNTITKKEKSSLTSGQKTFNRLVKTIKDLQIKQEETIRDIDLALQFYYETMKPDEAILSQCFIERIKIAYQLYKKPKGLSKNERKPFETWLLEEIDQVYLMSTQSSIPNEIKDIFKELSGSNYETDLAAEMKELQERMQNEFDMNVDLSDVNLEGSYDDVMKNIFFKLGQAASQRRQNFKESPKTKKQLEKESKKQAIKDMQSKSLHAMYKQLVRVLHPDLERDSQKRAWKEELMKKLTVAYENNDLYSLLSIEMEWMNASAGKIESQHDNDQELKIYNAILKDQIKELQASISMLIMHPRNLPIQKFYSNGFDGISSLKKRAVELKNVIQEIQGMIPQLQTAQGKSIFKKIISQRAMQNFMSQMRMSCQCGSC